MDLLLCQKLGRNLIIIYQEPSDTAFETICVHIVETEACLENYVVNGCICWNRWAVFNAVLVYVIEISHWMENVITGTVQELNLGIWWSFCCSWYCDLSVKVQWQQVFRVLANYTKYAVARWLIVWPVSSLLWSRFLSFDRCSRTWLAWSALGIDVSTHFSMHFAGREGRFISNLQRQF